MAAEDIIIFGGTGFVGRHLVDRLTRRGLPVRVVSRQPARALPSIARARYLWADITDPTSVESAIEDAAVVFHLATGAGDTWPDVQSHFVQGTLNIASACLRLGVRRLVYTSSIAALYLGEPGIIDERIGPDPRFEARNPYARGKILAERALRRLHAREVLPVVILRPGVVMGPGGPLNHAGLGTWPTDTCCVGWGRGHTPLPLVLVEDLAQALELAMDRPAIEGRTFNIAGDVAFSAADLVGLLATHSYRDYRFHPRRAIQRYLVELVLWILKRAAGRADAQPQTLRDIKSASLLTRIDCAAARRVLGWQPNSDPDVFVNSAIRANLRRVPAGDLRVSN